MNLEQWFYTLPLRLRSLVHRNHVEQELDEELRYHLERRIEEGVAHGLAPEEARYAALRAMEGLEQRKEECRDARGVRFFDDLARDLRYAGRMARQNPGFTAVAVASLALGIGATTAIFSLMNAVMLKSLPVKNPAQLLLLSEDPAKKLPSSLRHGNSGYEGFSLSYPTFQTLRQESRTATVIGFVPLGFGNQSIVVRVGGDTTVAGGEMVTGDYFSGLGVTPILGRPIARSDENPGAAHVVVISYAYWLRRFGGQPSIVGSPVVINGVPFTIIGVAPPEFHGLIREAAPDLWTPLREEAQITPWGNRNNLGISWAANRQWWWLMMIARRKSEVSEPQCRAELDRLFRLSIVAGVNPPPKPEDLPHVVVESGNQGFNFMRRSFAKPLSILMTAVGLLLLIACANVATLLLARAASRQKEMSVRLATGAGRGRLIRQLLTESVALAGAGGLLGLLLAQWASRALALLMSKPGESLGIDVQPDMNVLAFSAGVSMLTGILFGLAPALSATHVDLAGALKENTRSSSARLGLGNALIAAQVAFSLLLLVGAGLFLRTLYNLEHQEFGFNHRNLLLFAIDGHRAGYTGERLAALYNGALHQFETIPGVQGATASANALLSGWTSNGPISTDGPEIKSSEGKFVRWNTVGPRFFETMGIGTLMGRGIQWDDIEGRRRVAVVTEALARHFFPGQNPLGRHFNTGKRRNAVEDLEIVGVVQNAKYQQPREEAPKTFYVPYTTERDMLANLNFELRTAGDPAAVIPVVRRLVSKIDPSLALTDVKTQSEQVDESLSQERLFARLSTLFGGLALVLVAVGLSGTLAYAVTRRTNEIGIRMALGAARGRVLWMILRQSVVLIAAGIAVGLPAALAATRLIESQLYGVKANDPAAIGATVLILIAVGLAAGYLPARRASRVEPTVALRYE